VRVPRERKTLITRQREGFTPWLRSLACKR